jgi:hypothetical protein
MKKDEYTALRTLAATLPVIFNHSIEKSYVLGNELLEDNIEGAEADKLYLQSMPVMIAINHYRKMKRLYQKHGFSRVLSYMREVREYKKLNP